ncbi:TrkA-N domain-containing protein [Candidatus Magnetobacterium bavaricum]|uniref:TrkA-N domain-containing protein n=1 Tax=Candidatus Magnetobacterium bavaricum TaxID=29290 RepID=A0A0F3GM06_9BACT|nr:TrkA-N domain-containing protein [Candidatus Magnetobacterium bavaricum]
MLRDKDKNLRIEDVKVPDDITPRTVGSLHLKRYPTCMLLAIKTAQERWIYNPPEHQMINPDDTLIIMTTPGERIELRKIFHLIEPS